VHELRGFNGGSAIVRRRGTNFALWGSGEVTVRIDPEGNETEALFALVDLGDAEVLEIGCGDGRLTWRYGDRTAHVTAIDPFEDGIARAKHQLPEPLKGTIDLRSIAFEDFAAKTQSAAFDVAILSWSLC
jgi:2-polyprenyl-3-methyl-5-hydroxy-6-metoxy-1,4-benzoquinol methylase